MEVLKRIMFGLVGLAAIVAFKFWNKSSDHDDLKNRLIEICTNDTSCAEAVNTHFDVCFDKHYSIGNKRRSGGLNQEKFLGCFNELSGAEYFVVSKNEEGVINE